MTRLDRLTLTGLRAFAHHGVYAHEREAGQPFIVDVTVHLDLSTAGSSDRLGETIHYGVLAEEIVGAIERDPVDLIETLAERIALVVLSHRAARIVDVTVHKPEAPIPVEFADVTVSIQRQWTRAVVAIGANLGDREATIRQALLAFATNPATRVVAASPIVETPALKVEGVDESAPAYLNAVVELDTVLPPRALLAELHRIESVHGRTRETRWGDRTLDLDIITYGRERIAEHDLVIPHPRAHDRAFVLAPWAAMDEQAVLPGRGAVVELLAEVIERTGERVDPYPAEPLA
ncbi:MAG TPA: 2-amino-4-hydroxy-6-hydroxymethyldihydropteridine diphosphokinase [Microbacteriaceae bacterium]|nr:2-amino-4-hydroxy-6-hydroxymethyldihydropteridine diphosphokinase [Microbacteriaceae bacterium]